MKVKIDHNSDDKTVLVTCYIETNRDKNRLRLTKTKKEGGLITTGFAFSNKFQIALQDTRSSTEMIFFARGLTRATVVRSVTVF